jgi:hypothetical protein
LDESVFFFFPFFKKTTTTAEGTRARACRRFKDFKDFNKIFRSQNALKINGICHVWWANMGSMVGKYGVYGGQIWGLWWANMGSMVGKYGVLKNKALQK